MKDFSFIRNQSTSSSKEEGYNSNAMANPRGGGGQNPLRPPPPFPAVCFSSCFPFHPRGRSGRRTVPPPHNVSVAKKKKKKKNVSESPHPPLIFRPGAASRHLHSRPSLFTNPGSATAQMCFR